MLLILSRWKSEWSEFKIEYSTVQNVQYNFVMERHHTHIEAHLLQIGSQQRLQDNIYPNWCHKPTSISAVTLLFYFL